MECILDRPDLLRSNNSVEGWNKKNGHSKPSVWIAVRQLQLKGEELSVNAMLGQIREDTSRIFNFE